MTNDLPQDPELLRREIARTRADMDRTLAELEDRVSPSRIKERQTQKVRSRWHDVRTSVMGSADEARTRASGMTDEAQGRMQNAQAAAQQAPQRMEDATRGNPIAAGLIAMGVGALVGSLLPPSRPEQQAASELREQFEEPVKRSMQESGEEVKGQLQEHAQQAAEDTKQTAQRGADRVKGEAQGSAEQVQGQAQEAASAVRDRS